MMPLFRRLSATAALTGALLLAGFTAPANAQPADVLSFSLPAVGGIEIGRPAYRAARFDP